PAQSLGDVGYNNLAAGDEATDTRKPNCAPRLKRDRCRRNTLDDVALDQHIRRSGKGRALSVEDADIFEKHIVGARRGTKSQRENCREPSSADRKQHEKSLRARTPAL